VPSRFSPLTCILSPQGERKFFGLNLLTGNLCFRLHVLENPDDELLKKNGETAGIEDLDFLAKSL
jgi:hypothetical protein